VSDTWDAFPTAAPTESGNPRIRITPAGSEQSAAWDAFPTEKPTDYAGIAKQAGVGLAKGAAGLAGLPGDVQQLAQKGADYLKDKLSGIHWPEPSEESKKNAERYGSRGDLGPSFPMPTSADIQGAIEKVTGPWRKPQSQTEADAETLGEFVPAALAGPGGVARKVITQAAIPAAASVTAGRLTDQNPYVKALAGFVAGGAGALASGPSSAESIIRSKIPASVTEQDITRAGQLIDHGQARGVTLTWPEALSRVTGQPVLTDTQRILESHGQTRAAMNDVLAPRAAQVDQAARNELDQAFGPASQNPSMLGPQAQQAAEGTLNQMRAAINRATRPSYDAAGQTLVPVQVHAAMIADPLFEDALNAVRNDPARNAMVRGHSDRSVAVYDAVKKELQERSQNASNPVQPGHSQAVSSATGQMADTVRGVAIAADRHAGNTLPERVNVGPFSLDTTPISGKSLFHETSPGNAADLLAEDLTNNASGARSSRMFLADNPDIAIGQGGQGVRLEYRGNLVSGVEHKKPGTGDASGREYQANAIGNNAIQRVIIEPGQTLGLRPAWQRKFEATFEKTEMPDGTTVYERKPSAANYEAALQQQSELRAKYLEPLQRGPLGKLAQQPDTKRAIDVLFPSNPLPASEGEIRDAVGAVARTRPAVAQQLVRAHAEMVFNEAARDLQGGANAFSGAKFAKMIAGNSQQRANLQAAIEALPNGPERWHGFEQLLDIMSATGARQPKGSLTAFNALEIPSMSNSGLMDIATKGASPGKWMSFANDTFKAWSLGRNLDQIARILTDPRSGDALRQIVRIPAGSDRALVMAGRIIAQLGAATTEQRTNSDQQPGRNEGRSHAQ
jgi:hypothetical protein